MGADAGAPSCGGDPMGRLAAGEEAGEGRPIGSPLQPDAATRCPTEGRPRLVLHVCCAPCATAAIERLQADHDLVLFWYNPNITDRREHEKRLQEARRHAERLGLPLVAPPHDPGAWRVATRGLEAEPEGGLRCDACFRLRLRATAQAAREFGMAQFTTTLSISPHKSFKKIKAAGEAAADESGKGFLALDLKKRAGFQRSRELAAEHRLYRQDYCGCEFSRREAQARRARSTRG